jgi:tetratricopeptide (TPR) repeat protein
MRKLFGIFILVFLVSRPLWSQFEPEPSYWFTLERGKNFFRNGAYGDALIAFEDARNQRRDMYTGMRRDIINVLSIPEVRRFGDSLDLVEKYIADRRLSNPGKALEELYYRIPRESLDGSAQKILDEFDRLADYPEAEYWIGETYRVEGELGIALRQYQKAYEKRELLETPGFDLVILYRMADIHRLRQQYNEMETKLLEILKRDSLWSGDSDSFVRAAMRRTIENQGINRFLTLYRYNNPEVLEAHKRLGFYYYVSNRHDRASEHLLFVFLIENTALIEAVTRNQYGYTFTDIDELINAVRRNPVTSAYLEEIEYYKTAYYLGTSFYGTGKSKPAGEFLDFLDRRSDAGEWRSRAAAQLARPSVERALEMP